jgi:hypothetical protein
LEAATDVDGVDFRAGILRCEPAAAGKNVVNDVCMAQVNSGNMDLAKYRVRAVLSHISAAGVIDYPPGQQY